MSGTSVEPHEQDDSDVNQNQRHKREAEWPVNDVPQVKHTFGAVEERHAQNKPRLPPHSRDHRFEFGISRGEKTAERRNHMRAPQSMVSHTADQKWPG